MPRAPNPIGLDSRESFGSYTDIFNKEIQMTNTITKAAQTRYSVKAYDGSQKLAAPQVDAIKQLLQLSPSSINIQPWHFILASSDEAKARIAKAAHGNWAYNAPSIENASQVVLYCVGDVDEAHVDRIVAQEEKDGRYRSADSKTNRANMMKNYLNARNDAGATAAWALNQVYINLGFLLMGAAEMGIDATPMEGIDQAMLDEEFGLPARGLRACFVVTLGYSDGEKDYNATLPKSRLPLADVVEEI